ncbi:ABC transporter permease [Irregularibacter muris]|uniref:ABC transporter permease n=1 Tax=Irregularibacter muris TaxID=1796619 RepID=A0AAE3HF82_9FIRM|nr:ABC transporter permease [Irregularibacter muris]MCR1897473.1 ABC transporter permease [Irregularibacter muris]
MFLAEMKRRLYTKYVLFSILGIFMITIGLNLFITNDSKYISENLAEEAVYEGEINEENLLRSLIKVRDEQSDEMRYQSQVSIIHSLVNTYPGILYSENKVQDYPDELAKDFYKSWENKFEALIKLNLPAANQEVALEKLKEVRPPFVRYPGYYLYSTGLENIQIIFMIILFLVIFFASGTYSNSFEDESMEIIKGTKNYRKNMFIRILPSIFFGTALILICTLVTIGMISSIIGLKPLQSSFKMISLFSLGNFSIGQSILIMMLSQLLGVIALSTLMGYISLKTKETTKSIIWGVSFSILYMIGSRVVSSSAGMIKGLFNLIPIASSNMFNAIRYFSFPFGIWEPYIMLIGSFIVFVISTGVLTSSIHKN